MWNVKEDTFSISYRETESKEVTKRRILSLAHRIFDPIGFTCSITLIPKLLIQECWKIEASWDSKLPVDIERKFEAWKKQLIEIQDIKIPRRLSNLDLKDANLSLQVFCDASKLSYATCIFLRAEREGEVTCQLIQARSKVAPLKVNIRERQPCSSVSNGGARLEPRAETSSHQQAETSSMQPCSSVSNGGGGLKLRAETSGHQQAETSSMQPCSRVSDGEAGVEPRVETLAET
ncbi:integrase catalytic domain-containing protein [Trichonephila clavata]|uniref:Integrase catalytic domain-containing protein n=1 Tax=Trichonephila clavata TaxID=2740835 RepID=A0A8X6KTU4_TRICU|nr:integrase catalytic domain-containing protein [Trichonephila clavata]